MGDAYEDLLSGRTQDEGFGGYQRREPNVPRIVRCRFCGQDGFRWMTTSTGQWRLWDGATFHMCTKYVEYVVSRQRSTPVAPSHNEPSIIVTKV